MSIALYQLAAEYQQQFFQLAELDLPDEVVRDTLEGMDGEIQVKAANVAMMIRHLQHTAEGIKEAEAAMKARRAAIERRADSISNYLLTHLQACGITKVEHPMLRVSVRACPESVDVIDAGQIPAEYMRPPAPPSPAPDKAAIKEAMKAGTDVPGCRLVRGNRLEIR